MNNDDMLRRLHSQVEDTDRIGAEVAALPNGSRPVEELTDDERSELFAQCDAIMERYYPGSTKGSANLPSGD